MKFFFDNNLSPHLARAMEALSGIFDEVEQVVHLRDIFPGNVPDIEWIARLAESGPWCVISLDRFKSAGDAEREALRRAGHTVFMLEKQWAAQLYWAKAERMVSWWPQIVTQAGLVAAGAFVVPWHHSKKAKFRAIRL